MLERRGDSNLLVHPGEGCGDIILVPLAEAKFLFFPLLFVRLLISISQALIIRLLPTKLLTVFPLPFSLSFL